MFKKPKSAKMSRKGAFLEIMNAIIPWKALCATIEPYYANDQEGSSFELEVMFRIYFLQHCFCLSDRDVEGELYDSYAMRKFSKLGDWEQTTPDEVVIQRFRNLLEVNGLAKDLIERINTILAQNGVQISRGRIVEPTITREHFSAE